MSAESSDDIRHGRNDDEPMDLSGLWADDRGRKLSVEAMVESVRHQTGLALVNGFSRVVGGRGFVSYNTHLPMASAMQLGEAHLLRHEPGAALEWETDPIPSHVPVRGVALTLPMAMGAGSAFPEPTARLDLRLNGRSLLSFAVDKRARRWRGDDALFSFEAQWVKTAPPGGTFTLDPHIRAESTFADGIGVLLAPSELVTAGLPSRIEIRVIADLPSARWIRIGKPREPFVTDDVGPALDLALSEPAQPDLAGRRVLFGDLHNHSGETGLAGLHGCGRGTRAGLFEYARDVAGLDFFCLSEHDWQMNDDDWQQLAALTETFDEPGRFATIPGFEWTSPAYGHRNVYFRNGAGPLIRSGPEGTVNQMHEDDPTPVELWNALETSHQAALTVPHHMSAAQFPLSIDAYHRPEYDRVAEIYSCWGDSLEHSDMATLYAHRVQDLAFINAVRKGYRVGFVASSDSHDGHPGNAQGTDTHNHLYHYLGSGRTAVLADDFNHESIFDALRARRCYALTDGLVLASVSLEGHQMGSVVPAAALPAHPELHIEVDSNSPIDEVVVYRNGEAVDRLRPGTRAVRQTWIDESSDITRDSSYFVKFVRADHEMAWTSPIWVTRRHP